MNLVQKLTEALYSYDSGNLIGARAVLVNPETFDQLKQDLVSGLYRDTIYENKVRASELTKPHKLEFHGRPIFRSPDIPENEFYVI